MYTHDEIVHCISNLNKIRIIELSLDNILVAMYNNKNRTSVRYKCK